MSHLLRFPGFRLRAFTMSYDDGVFQDEKLIEIMKKNGLRGTFNIPSGFLDREGGRWLSRERALEVYSQDGIEVAVHGVEHLKLPSLPTAVATRDILFDRAALEELFGGVICGMAYAYGSTSNKTLDVLRASGIEYARTTVSTRSFALPDNWLLLNPTCHHNDPELFGLLEKFLAKERNSFWSDAPRLFYVWGHSYEFDNHDNWDVIERFAEEIGGRDDVYYATNGEIYRYVKAFEALRFSTDLKYVDNPTATDLYINVLGKNVLVPAGKTVKI